MPRTPIWKSIAAELEGEIARHLYRAGDKLPTEAELSARFGVNRHTARRALADLAERGLVHSRRGAGVFVTATPLDYAIGARVRFHRNIRATGRLPEKRVLRVETRPADTAEAEALALPPGAPVIVYEGLSLAEGAPIAHFFSCFPAERLPGLADTLRDLLGDRGAAPQRRDRLHPRPHPAHRRSREPHPGAASGHPRRRAAPTQRERQYRPGGTTGGIRADLVRRRPGGTDRRAGGRLVNNRHAGDI
jgi:hypothetical protein